MAQHCTYVSVKCTKQSGEERKKNTNWQKFLENSLNFPPYICCIVSFCSQYRNIDAEEIEEKKKPAKNEKNHNHSYQFTSICMCAGTVAFHFIRSAFSANRIIIICLGTFQFVFESCGYRTEKAEYCNGCMHPIGSHVHAICSAQLEWQSGSVSNVG